MSKRFSAEDLDIPIDIANTTIMDMPRNEFIFLLLEQKADRDPRHRAAFKLFIDRMFTTKMHIILIILPRIFQAFPSQFSSLLSALEFAWRILLADCRYRCKEANPYNIMMDIAHERWPTAFRNANMSSTLLQRINDTRPLLDEARLDASSIRDYLLIHFKHRSAERETGILSRYPMSNECRDGGNGTDARIIRLIVDDASPMDPVYAIVPGHYNIQYAIAKRSSPDESEYRPGLRTGDSDTDMLKCIYGSDGFEPDTEPNDDTMSGFYYIYSPRSPPHRPNPETEAEKEDTEKEDTTEPLIGQQIDYAEEDDEEHNNNLQIMNETHEQRMKRIADTARNREGNERKKPKLDKWV